MAHATLLQYVRFVLMDIDEQLFLMTGEAAALEPKTTPTAQTVAQRALNLIRWVFDKCPVRLWRVVPDKKAHLAAAALQD